MDKEQKAIQRIQLASEQSLHHYGKPLIVTYSGGKDSDVLLEMFKRSGVPFEVNNSHTTVDAPPTVYHIRKKFKELSEQGIKCTIDYHVKANGTRDTMWNLIPRKLMPPTRLARYCCSSMKESSCSNSFIATGVRWDESTGRKSRTEFEKIGRTKAQKEQFTSKMLLENNDASRRLTELCMQKNKMVVNPIIDWTDSDVWEFLNSQKVETNPLYCEGYKRVGCVGCPMATLKMKQKEFADFPVYKDNYIRAFGRMLDEIKARGGKARWKNGNEVFHWWIQDDWQRGQMTFDLDMNVFEED